MQRLPVILIFDVGKTNKKLLLFDEQYKVVWEESVQLNGTRDEDDFPCEDVYELTSWLTSSLDRLLKHPDFLIKAINFSAYGASFVYLDESGAPILPIYNYLKPYPEPLLEKFYNAYGGKERFSSTTASPVLGSLNSGMQLYRVKHEQPEILKKIKYALHLPQYLSYLISKSAISEITSVGCHTNLWDFENNNYHPWIAQEDLLKKFPAFRESDGWLTVEIHGREIFVGSGLHDSSAALIPYLSSFSEPFVLISTGTWCISLNPFNHSPLTSEELKRDCLCYLSYQNKPVKASRLLSGPGHDQVVSDIARHFHVSTHHLSHLEFNPSHHGLGKKEPDQFNNAEEAYASLIDHIIEKQVASTQLVLQGTSVKNIFVDGGFGKNRIFMNRLAASFTGKKVSAATVSQASAMGAALVIHKSWNHLEVPLGIIDLETF
jgi:sugar (pentulose or hexulose) kinase